MNNIANQIAALNYDLRQVQEQIDGLPRRPGQYIGQEEYTQTAKRKLPALLQRRERIETSLSALFRI